MHIPPQPSLSTGTRRLSLITNFGDVSAPAKETALPFLASTNTIPSNPELTPLDEEDEDSEDEDEDLEDVDLEDQDMSDGDCTDVESKADDDCSGNEPLSSRFYLVTPKADDDCSGNEPLSSRSYLVTPETALCSTPQGWQANLPQKKPLSLTFGIELEHIFAWDRARGEEFKLMLADKEPVLGQGDQKSKSDCTNCPHCIALEEKRQTLKFQQRILKRSGLDCTLQKQTAKHWDLTLVGSPYRLPQRRMMLT